MKEIGLKNGSRVPEVMVSTTMTSLEELFNANVLSFYEFVMKCRDQNHEIDHAHLTSITALKLISGDGVVHDAVRDIVLSAVTGDGLDMTLGSPIDA